MPKQLLHFKQTSVDPASSIINLAATTTGVDDRRRQDAVLVLHPRSPCSVSLPFQVLCLPPSCVTRTGTYFCSLVTPEPQSRSTIPNASCWTRVSALVLLNASHVLTFSDVGTSGDAAADKHKSHYESMQLIPILTSFVASLERGAPFRISIHSWNKPKPSQLLLSYKTPRESTIFEARVYIDGVLVA